MHSCASFRDFFQPASKRTIIFAFMTGFDEVLPPDVQKSDSAILSRFQGPHERSSASRYEFSRLRKILNAREARTPFRTALEESVIRPDTLVIIPVQAVAISEDESESIRSHIGSGGSVLLLVGESTNLRMISSVNSLLEHFGISVRHPGIAVFDFRLIETLFLRLNL